MGIVIITGTTPSTKYLYNDFYYTLSANTSNLLNHKYIVDVDAYPGLVLNSAGRFKFINSPTTNRGYFTPHNILQHYSDNQNVNPTITTPTLNNNGLVAFTLKWGEEYDRSTALSAATGTTIYSNLITTTGIGLNAVHQFDEPYSLQDYDWSNIASTVHTKFLTPWDTTKYKKIFFGEYETGFIYTSNPSFATARIDVVTFDSALNNIATTSYNITGAGFSNYRHEIPMGTANLGINSPSVYYYSVTLYNSINRFTKNYYYQINQDCPRYDKVRITWLNQLGGYDYWTFYLIERNFISVKRNEWVKKPNQNYNIGDRGRTTLGVNGQQSFQVTSEWLTTAESDFISQMFTSPNIYRIDSTGTKIPLQLKNTDLEIKKVDNDKIINYTLDFEYAFKNYGQNG